MTRKLTEYNKFVQKKMKDMKKSPLKQTTKMKKIAELWNKKKMVHKVNKKYKVVNRVERAVIQPVVNGQPVGGPVRPPPTPPAPPAPPVLPAPAVPHPGGQN